MIRRFIWQIVHICYALVKPLIFLVPPDATHNGMIKFAVIADKFVPLCWITKAVFYKRHYAGLEQEICGVKFNNPVGLAAGLDKNGEIIPTMRSIGFGFATTGSVTARVCAGNPRPWFHRLPRTKSLVVNAGLGNVGSVKILKRVAGYKNIANFPVVLSVAKTNSQKVVSVADGIDDYVTTIKRAKNNPNISMIELNISCPNAFGGEPFTTPARLERLLKAVAKVGVKVPITVKMPVDLPYDAFRGLLDVIVRYPVQMVTIANLYKDRSKIDVLDDFPDTVRGNMSGQPTRDPSNDLIRQTYRDYGDRLKIIGVGGIFCAEDAYTKIKLGASLVELITGMVFYGPQLPAEINYDLAKLLAKDGYSDISDAIGVEA